MQDAWAKGSAEDQISELFQLISRKKDKRSVDELINRIHFAYINVKDHNNDYNCSQSYDYSRAIEALDSLSDLSLTNDKGQTPLHTALELPSFWLTSIFSMAGINPNQQDNKGNTPLHLVSNINEAEILIAHQADPRIKNNDGKTPSNIALEKGLKDVSTLLDKKAISLNRAKAERGQKRASNKPAKIKIKSQLTD